MTFDPKKYVAAAAPPEESKGFDPKAYAAPASQDPSSGSNTSRELQTAAKEYVNAAAAGHGSQLETMLAPLLDRTTGAIAQKLSGMPETAPAPWAQMIPGSAEYIKARDADIKQRMALAAENPKSALGGKLAGIAAGALTAGKLLPGAAGASAVQTGAEGGAIIGGLQNPGDTEGEAGLQLGERLKGAAEGGATGAVFGAIPGILSAASDAGKWAVNKAGSALTGLSEQDLANYAKRTKDVNDLIAKSGGDISEAADITRKQFSNALQAKKTLLNNEITTALEDAPKDKTIPVGNIIDQLNKWKDKLNPNFKADQIAEIEDSIAKIQSESGPQGLVDLQGLYDIKNHLMEASKTAYVKNGQIFARTKEVARAAKDAERVARSSLNALAPEIAQANNGLYTLHTFEDSINKNLIAPGTPDAALIAAGSGGNARNAANLKKLERLTGVNATEQAQNLSAARTFANPSVLPVDTTGKSLTRLATGAGLGLTAGPVGAAAGGALASPLTAKLVINGIDKVSPLFTALSKMISTDPVKATYIVQALTHPTDLKGPAPIDPATQDFFKSNPKLIQDIPDPQLRNTVKDAVRKPTGAIERRISR